MDWIKRIFRDILKKPAKKNKLKITPAQAEKMLEMIQNTRETELSCDEVHDLLGQFAEMALRGENAAGYLPLVHYHLEKCPDCKEEYEALTRILQAPIGN